MLDLIFVLLQGCTNLIVTKGASADGSVMFSYAADSANLYGAVEKHAAADHDKNSVIHVISWDEGDYLGDIPQVDHTYAFISGAYSGGINEHQVMIGETTYGGIPSLQHQPKASLDYGTMMQLGLARASSARQAIDVMTGLVAKHGYASEGESLTVADANEVWILDMIGKGTAELGAVWVAVRIPDGHISGHANQARITQFPRNDPDNCVYSQDVVSFAVSQGLYPKDGSEADFSFSDVYDPLTFVGVRGGEARVWEFLSNHVPGFGHEHLAYASGHDLSKRMPLSVKPARPVGINDTMYAMRTNYQGTPFAMTKDVGAGPYNAAMRASPLYWKDSAGDPYFNERPVGTQQTGWHFVAQARSWLPGPIGAVLWFAVDDSSLSAHTPIYVGATQMPPAFTDTPADGVTAGVLDFSLHSAYWIFNLVANLAYSRYDAVAPLVHAAIAKHETAIIAAAAKVDDDANKAYKDNQDAAISALTNFTVASGQELLKTWTALWQHLFVTYKDGFTMERPTPPPTTSPLVGKPKYPGEREMPLCWQPGYPLPWLDRIANDVGDRLKLPEHSGATGEGFNFVLPDGTKGVSPGGRHSLVAAEMAKARVLEGKGGRSRAPPKAPQREPVEASAAPKWATHPKVKGGIASKPKAHAPTKNLHGLAAHGYVPPERLG